MNENEISNDEESFEELLKRTAVKPVRLNPGEKIKGVVVNITNEWAFIDLGGKSEGAIELSEFMDGEGNISIKTGDSIEAFFLTSRNNEMLFTTKLSGKSSDKELLEEAYHNGIPIEGTVEKEIKGGFDIKIAGNKRAFCPYSQMGLPTGEQQDDLLGQVLTFKIIEYSENGRNIIVSHRVIQEEEREKQKADLLDSLQEGMTVSGRITSIQKFGAFVDIGGIEGLIPISEISWGRIEDIGTVLSEGQTVDVMIKKLDWANEKYSFSLKEILPDPWDNVRFSYPEGSVHKGKVTRLVKFGAFITLEPGIDGLVHISELGKGKRINHPKDVLEAGMQVEVKINKVDDENRRLSLSIFSDDQVEEDSMDLQERLIKISKESSGSFGSLGDLFKEKLNNSGKRKK